ncbi:hypothetical protein U9M48_024168 [Paspalum notatum var. saurae]|uniref:Uncharacterized protein n=1 Tax=Paspalum notatum var. saurae TaxID=547442 RepID=A0AAQ3TN24_PASNO
MTDWTEVPIEERHLGGMVDLLKEVLLHLGVRPKKLRYRAMGREDWDPVRVYLEIGEEPRAGVDLHFWTVRCAEAAPSVYQAIQKVTMTALKQISRDYRAHLENSPYRFLPQNPLTTQSSQATQEMEEAPEREEDSCLEVTARYLLEQDSYLQSLENDYSRLDWHFKNTVQLSKKQEADNKLLTRDREMLLKELMEFQEVMKQKIQQERYMRLTMQARMDRTEKQAKEVEATNTQMGQALVDLTKSTLPLLEENRRLKRKIAYLEQNNAHNAVNLTNLLRMSVYLQEKEERMLAAWRASDARRQKELREMRSQLPPEQRSKIRRENFGVPRTHLRVRASFRDGWKRNQLTPEMAKAIEVSDYLFYPGSAGIRKKIVDFDHDERILEEPDSDAGEMQVFLPQ